MALGRIRTDLALETKEKFEEDNVEIRGVIIEEDYNEEKDIRTTTVKIETENGAKAMGRPQGVYITLEAPNMSVPDEDYHREISKELAKHIRKLIPVENELTALVVGLGNREVTPDALGPDVVSNLHITRHVIQEYGVQSMGKEYANSISGLVPGVMAQTGMETLEIIRGVVDETKPDVDAWLRVEETILDVPAGDVTKEAYLFVPENLEEVDRFVHLRIRESREPYVLDDDHVLITEKMAGLLAFRLPTYTGKISC